MARIECLLRGHYCALVRDGIGSRVVCGWVRAWVEGVVSFPVTVWRTRGWVGKRKISECHVLHLRLCETLR